MFLHSHSPTPPRCPPFLQVATFAAEFMKRKLTEAAAAAGAGGGKKSRKAKAKANATAAAAAAVAPAPAAPSAVFPALGAVPPPPPPAALGKSGTDWEKVPKTAGGKKKAKGKKVDAQLLGFNAGTNYAALEQLQ